ncbi:MAG TPA: serine hydrolase, partial [Agriterribacter sp.]|nr:serine hydrolase [Agriterribacter sp.]
KKAIRRKKLGWKQIDERVKKVLQAKYRYGLSRWQPVNTHHLVRDLNTKTAAITRSIAANAITALRLDDPVIPLLPLQDLTKTEKEPKVAYIGFGINRDNTFARLMRGNYNADVFYFDYKEDASRVTTLAALLETRYDAIVIGIHHYNRFPAGNFGISTPAIQLLQHLQPLKKTISFVFGNPYIIKNFCDAKNMIACYEDDAVTQQTAVDILAGRKEADGSLPVTVAP